MSEAAKANLAGNRLVESKSGRRSYRTWPRVLAALLAVIVVVEFFLWDGKWKHVGQILTPLAIMLSNLVPAFRLRGFSRRIINIIAYMLLAVSLLLLIAVFMRW